MPLPAHLKTCQSEICNTLVASKDVDCMTDLSNAGVYSGKPLGFPPCTPQACMEILDHYGIDPCLIEIEITETTFVSSLDRMLSLVDVLHRTGFQVAMDDFGSGYSTFNMLKNIPVDVLKVDRLFFQDFVSDPRTRLILDVIFSLAGHLDLITVAEGVEQKEEADYLKEKGCSYIQGFYYFRPMPEAQFQSLMDAQSVD